MAREQSVTEIPGAEEQRTKAKEAAKQKAKPQKAKPTKPLPTDRIQFPKQLDLLRAYAAASGPDGRPVTNEDVGRIVKMMASTVSMANAFFSDTGLLRRAEKGGYFPSEEVKAFNLAYQWNPETASYKLGPILQETWFAKALLPRLSFRPLKEEDAISTLAEAVAAGPDYKDQLRVLLDYLKAGGLIQIDGDLIRLAEAGLAATAGGSPETAAPAPERREPTGSRPAQPIFGQPTQGVIQFHLSVKVDMTELAGWEADRIKAFFNGVAQVLAAKGALEQSQE